MSFSLSGQLVLLLIILFSLQLPAESSIGAAVPSAPDAQLRQKNYQAIQDAFSKCSTNATNPLTHEILDAAANARLDGNTCKPRPSNFDDLKRSLDANIKSDLQREIFEQSMKNAAASYMDLKYKYSGATNPNIVLDLCRSTAVGRGANQETCGADIKAAMVAAANQYLARASGQHYTPAEAATEINARINSLNADLSAISMSKPKGVFFKTASLNEAEQSSFDDVYVAGFLKAASNGPGLLMMTDHMRDAMGGLRTQSDIERKQAVRYNQYLFTPHKNISASDVSTSIDEAANSIHVRAQELALMEMDRAGAVRSSRGPTMLKYVDQARNNDLKNLVEVNPVAVGQVLLNHPEMAGPLCEVITQFTADDLNKAKVGKYTGYASFVVGGILAVTGVGTALGAYLMGSAALATASTVIGVTGAVVSGADAFTSATAAVEAKQAAADHGASVLAGSGNEQNVREAANALQDYKNAAHQAELAGVLTAADIGALSGALKVAAKLRPAARMLNDISSDPRLVSAAQELRSALGADDSNKLLGYLAQLPKDMRSKILDNLANSNLADPELKAVIRKALEAADKGKDPQLALADLARGNGNNPIVMNDASPGTPKYTSDQIADAERRQEATGFIKTADFHPIAKNDVVGAMKNPIVDAAGNKDFEGYKTVGRFKFMNKILGTKPGQVTEALGKLISRHKILDKAIGEKPGTEVSYFVDRDGTIYITDKPTDLTSLQRGGLMRNSAPGRKGEVIEPVEVGKVHFDEHSNPVFESQVKEDAPDPGVADRTAGGDGGAAEGGGDGSSPSAKAGASQSDLVTKSDVLRCSKLASGATSIWLFLGLPIGIDELSQGTLMYIHGRFTKPLDKANSTGRLLYIVMVDMQMKLVDEFMMDTIHGRIVPVFLKGNFNKGDEWFNERFNRAVIYAARKVGADITEKDLKAADALNKATAKGNYEANIGQKVLAGTAVDYYLKNAFASHMMAFCLANPKWNLVVNSLVVRSVERLVGSTAAGFWVDHRTHMKAPVKDDSAQPAPAK